MTREKREPESGGRRTEDQWLSRIVKGISVVAALVAVCGFVFRTSNTLALAETTSVRVDTVAEHVRRLEQSSDAISYMTCVNFSETHPQRQVPKFCDGFTRNTK